ncbi:MULTISPECIES: UbiX family flavin prenyltransferase [Brevibacillus]|jgi:4-hydroxy-3-polyprenylbenzoate decarboxylase|uniref:Flavin prenyltransferase UbiX n=1 Tax=Brevibacillus thermoruber TaxID=33942 RepID=A0A9X3TLV8_9BACL|nr:MULTISPECIES: flavin prenyltransferase UbiX [Brevibacillus]MDA5106867.1 UbiX family flavin prenyltransferase [Brevibacillus thermoruber]UYZ11768.1 UbiX family flavin prenyltransferase [Brevibacillus sp. WF146]
MSAQKWAVGITGASGAVYGVRLVRELLRGGHTVHLMITEAGWQVFRDELDWNTDDREALIREKLQQDLPGALHYWGMRDFNCPAASGSYRCDGMVVVPCSMGTLSGIAHGASGNLLERVADVMLKERRRLVLVPRETPLNAIQLENMLKLSRLGVTILPAMPGYYHKPQTMDDLVNFVVGKALDALDVPHELFRRWGE